MRRLLPLVLAAVLAVGSVLPPQAYAAGSSDELGLSRDGAAWSDHLTEPLFEPGTRWVPGDVRSRSFLARNQSADPARLYVQVLTEEGAGLFEFLRIEVRVAGGRWEQVTVGETDLERREVAAGAQESVEIRAGFAANAPNDTMDGSGAMDLYLTLEGNAAPGPPGEDDESGSGLPLLPDTGAPALAGLIALAAALIGAGVALIARGRKEPR